MKNKQIFSISICVLWSIVLGTAMHDWTIGICMGICIGMAFGLFESSKNDEKKGEQIDE
ncbi:MAG: hypothetical protein IJK53_09920 [Erysipelotrichaceae bacterium]|nr:hypothetical protein [Erysipelotrichaceae bacterium]